MEYSRVENRKRSGAVNSEMENVIVSTYVIDNRNIGDLLSSPTNYFEFPGSRVETLDFRALRPNANPPRGGFGGSLQVGDLQNPDSKFCYHLLVGGGGLLFKSFRSCYERLQTLRNSMAGTWIAWGIGQQIYDGAKTAPQDTVVDSMNKVKQSFDYQQYLSSFDLVGIRDFAMGYDWLPCASCMHPEFDRERQIQHEFVVFSHRKFQLKVGNLPRMTNETQSFAEVLDFLGSGETILTSSYHGAYWGMLLGRKVLAFPFSTKFLTLRHQPCIYPVEQWRPSGFRFRLFRTTFLNKLAFEFRYGDRYWCKTNGWRDRLQTYEGHPTMLQEYRQINLDFYQRALDVIHSY